MSIRATLLGLIAVLALATIALAGARFSDALRALRLATTTVELSPAFDDLSLAAADIDRERLRLQALLSSAKRLRSEAAAEFEAVFADSDASVDALLAPHADRPWAASIRASIAEYRALREAAFAAARESAMTRDATLARDWLAFTAAAPRALREGPAEAAASAAADHRAAALLNGRAASVAALEALLRDMARIGALRASGAYFSAAAAGELAGFRSLYVDALDRVERAMRGFEAAEVVAEAVARLQEDYLARRDAVYRIGVDGGAFPEEASAALWFEAAETALEEPLWIEYQTRWALTEWAAAHQAEARVALGMAIAVIAAALLIAAGALFVLRLKVLRPLDRAVGALAKLAGGDLDLGLDGLSKRHEIGALRGAILRLRDVSENAAALEQAKAAAAAEEHRQLQAGAKVVAQVDALIASASRGEFARTGPIEAAGARADTVALAEKVQKLRALIAGFVGAAKAQIEALERGVLSRGEGPIFEGEFDAVMRGLDATTARLGQIVGRIRASAKSVRDAGGAILQGADALTDRAETQAAALEDAVTTMAEIATAVQSNADHAAKADQTTRAALSVARAAQAVADQSSEAMRRIGEGAVEVSRFTGMVDEIAFQTNLLALNASVEAARAGEAGRGFAVVAQEVRNLAQRAAEAAAEIRKLNERSEGEVREGVRLVADSGAKLGAITEDMTRISAAISAIAASSREQSDGLAEISATIADIDQSTQQNASLAAESSEAAQRLADQSDALADAMAFFSDEDAPPERASAA